MSWYENILFIYFTKRLFAGTVPANKLLFAGIVPANNLFHYIMNIIFMVCPMAKKRAWLSSLSRNLNITYFFKCFQMLSASPLVGMTWNSLCFKQVFLIMFNVTPGNIWEIYTIFVNNHLSSHIMYRFTHNVLKILKKLNKNFL